MTVFFTLLLFGGIIGILLYQVDEYANQPKHIEQHKVEGDSEAEYLLDIVAKVTIKSLIH